MSIDDRMVLYAPFVGLGFSFGVVTSGMELLYVQNRTLEAEDLEWIRRLIDAWFEVRID
jgi:hypothetical protein